MEAGGLVGDMEGNDTHMHNGNVLAGNPRIFGQLLQIIAPHLTEALKATSDHNQ
jgi:myo-inositol-1(or 4)-monophosphatase